MTLQTIPTDVFKSINAAFGVPAGRNSLPEAHAPKREVSVATRAARQMTELLVMRRALDATADRELCVAIAAAEAALLKVQAAAGHRAVLVA